MTDTTQPPPVHLATGARTACGLPARDVSRDAPAGLTLIPKQVTCDPCKTHLAPGELWVTDRAVAAAVAAAQWEWTSQDEDGTVLPTPQECMRPILQAAAPHILDERIQQVLALHQRKPFGGCRECVHDSSWPCSTARALGVTS